MCSDEEIKIRQELHQVSIFELERGQDINTKLAKINPEYAVKWYKRSAADTDMNNPNSIRPLPILSLTLDYLLDEIMDVDQVTHSFKIYTFVADRVRAIRQDLAIIGDTSADTHIEILQRIARFYCLAMNEGIGLENYDQKHNLDQLKSTLLSLRESYQEVNSMDDVQQPYSDNQLEFLSYSIVVHIDDQFLCTEILRSISELTAFII